MWRRREEKKPFFVYILHVMELSHDDEADEKILARYGEIKSALPKGRSWISTTDNMCQHQGFWYTGTMTFPGVLWIQQHFQARPTDIFLVSSPKCGSTWFKALVFSIVHRTKYSFCNHPLLTNSPHECVPFMELRSYREQSAKKLDFLPSPRVIASHIPYTSLPESIINSGCKIVYVCRNPKDVFVSLWHFVVKIRGKDDFPFQEAFDLFCNGISPAGPFWEHVLGYWTQNLGITKRSIVYKIRGNEREAIRRCKENFLGCCFSLQEEESGLVDEILQLCSFDNEESGGE